MYGVVLWSDPRKQKALIWCEDHGNLAFTREDLGTQRDGQYLESGDLVSFDVTAENGMRLAVKVALVASDEFPTLAEGLRNASPEQPPNQYASSGANYSTVVPLQPELPPLQPQTVVDGRATRKQA